MRDYKKEIVLYLEKVSKNTFKVPKVIIKPGERNNPKSYDYDYENSEYFKVIKNDDNTFSYLEYPTLNSWRSTKYPYLMKKIDIDWYVSVYKGNAKSVISDILFKNKKMKSIRQTKFVIDDIKNIIDNK